jgi:hypothetical protein
VPLASPLGSEVARGSNGFSGRPRADGALLPWVARDRAALVVLAANEAEALARMKKNASA